MKDIPRIYLSFLGLGTKNENTGEYDYRPTIYELNGRKSKQTKFVQVAELEILGSSRFDNIIIVATQKSYDTHFKNNLKHQLMELGAKNITPIIISEDMSAKGQWEWFEKILDYIDYGTSLSVDLTHGYRSIPIVFSAAITFLQKSRNIKIEAVYYGAYDKNRELAPIIDMKEFFMINEWAEAVSRLVEDADARKLAKVAERTPAYQVQELNEEEMIQAFEALTGAIRNVDINNVSYETEKTLTFIRQKEDGATGTSKILLKLLKDKFAPLATSDPLSGYYDGTYFSLQLEIIGLLLEHRLFMQAYTAMRELVGSIGMIPIEGAKFNNAKGRGYRSIYAEVFVKMFQYEKCQWKFDGKAGEAKDKLLPFYDQLVETGIEAKLRSFSKTLADYRNGFDHAWTMKAKAFSDIEEKGQEIYQKLREIVQLLHKKQLLR